MNTKNNILKRHNDYLNKNDNLELIELLNLKKEDYKNDLSESKINELKSKLKEKIIILEKLYREKYIKLEEHINIKLNFRELIIKKYRNEYIESRKYYTECLNEIRFNEDLINLNNTHNNLIKELTEINLKKDKLKNIRLLDKFYFECNNSIILKNDKIFDDKEDYNYLKSGMKNYIEKIKSEYEINKKSLLTIINKLENSLKILENQQNAEILEEQREANIIKNKINNKIIDIHNKIQQLEVNNNFDNLKILQKEKYQIDIDLNKKKTILIEKKFNQEIISIKNNYLKKKKQIESKIKYNEDKLINEDIYHQEKIEKKKNLIKNYEKYYITLENENEYLIDKNKNIEKNIYSINNNLNDLDIFYLQINNNISNILKKKDILTAKLSKKYKYYLNIYEDDLYEKKLKIYDMKDVLNKIKKMNMNDKDLIHIQKKIIIIKKFLEEN